MTLVSVEATSGDLASLDVAALAAMANEENRLVDESIEAALDGLSAGLRHAIRCGELLVSLQARIIDTTWAEWFDANLTFTQTSASQYVRIYTYRDQIPDAQMGLGTALAHLRGLPPTGLKRGRPRQHGDDVRDEAERLRREGSTPTEIGAALGVSRDTVILWTDPAAKKAYEEGRLQRRRERKEALRAKRRADSVAKAGGSIRKSYDMVRKLTRELDAALGNTTDPDIRSALRAAYSAATRSEAEILRAMKIE